MMLTVTNRSTPYPNHSITVYTYDTHGNRLNETRDQGIGPNFLNLTRSWTYESDGSVKTETDADGHTTEYTYDNFGNLAMVTDAFKPVGNKTQYFYTKTGFPDYPALSLRTKVIDGNGHETFYVYDDLDRLIQETDPLGFVTNTFYDPVGNRTAVQRQVALAPNPDWQLTTYVYDSRDRLKQETSDPSGDPRNTHTSPLNLVTSNTYDGNNNRKTVTDPRLKITSMDYDFQNRLSKVTDAQKPVHGVTEYRYDGVGNRTCVIDANGHDTFYEYDGLNRLTIESRKIGAQSCTTGIGDPNDLVTQTAYDTGNTIPEANCKNPQCAGPIPGSNSPASRIDPENKYSYFKYDALNRGVMTIRKQGAMDDSFDGDDWSEITQYDGADNVLARTDANGNVRGYSYYDNNWLYTDTIDPGTPPAHLNETTTYTYDHVGNVDTVTAPNGNVTDNTYNGRNELTEVFDSVGKVAAYRYDGIGNRTMQQSAVDDDHDGTDNTTSYVYDAVNRLVQATDPMNNPTGYGYDANGNLLRVEDREQHLTCYLYDDINRRTHVVQKMDATPSDPAPSDCPASDAGIIPKDIVTKTDYDLVGNVDRLTDSNNNPTDYDYDEADRLVLETYADETTRFFLYDNSGHLKKRTDQLGRVTGYDYSDLYYLLKRNYVDVVPTIPEPDDSYQYDVGGRMTRAERDTWIVTFDGYDAANRLLHTTQDATSTVPMELSYTYDIPGRTRTIVNPSLRTVNKNLDARDRLDNLASGAFSGDYVYDLDNRVETRSYNNGIVATYDYNANNWIESLDHKKGAVEIADFHHEYDKEDNKVFTAKSPDAVKSKSEAYAYDPIYRLIDYRVGDLVGSTVPVPTTQHEYNLDELGNWPIYKRNGVTFFATPNQMNEYDDFSTNGPGDIPDDDGIQDDFDDLASTPGVPDGENFAHDKNGNRRKDGARTFEYDAENRLVTMISGGNRTEYVYDALGRRVKKVLNADTSPTVTRYAYDDARIVEDQTAAGDTLATYVHGNYIDEVLTMQRKIGAVYKDFYYHQDTLWSVAAITDASGNVVERYNYTDYGCSDVTHSVIGNPYLYTGRQLDEEGGLYYYRARYYDCGKGRFLQRDPSGTFRYLSLYEYAASKPLFFIDPKGLSNGSSVESFYADIFDKPETYGGGGGEELLNWAGTDPNYNCLANMCGITPSQAKPGGRVSSTFMYPTITADPESMERLFLKPRGWRKSDNCKCECGWVKGLLTYIKAYGSPDYEWKHAMLQSVDCTWESKNGETSLYIRIADPIAYAAQTTLGYLHPIKTDTDPNEWKNRNLVECWQKRTNYRFHGNCNDWVRPVMVGMGRLGGPLFYIPDPFSCCYKGSGPLHCCCK